VTFSPSQRIRRESIMVSKDEILSLERKFWDAIQAKDAEGAAAMIGEQCIVAGAQGVARIDRATYVKMAQTGKWTLHEYEMTDVQVVEAGPDAAVIGYKVRERLTMEGREMTLEAADTSVWCRRDGRWLCMLHTESVLGDPFGRDRSKDS
jgi:ketosteroid isomerase-like protein